MRSPITQWFSITILFFVSYSAPVRADCDDLETTLWPFSHTNENYDGTWVAEYTTTEAYSPTQSIRMSVVGGGTSGQDFDHILATRIYPLTGTPGALSVWFNFSGFNGSIFFPSTNKQKFLFPSRLTNYF